MDLGLKGKKAIVTGGTRGIGRAIATLLAAEGTDVAICARNREAVDRTVAQLKEAGVNAAGGAVDVADLAALRRWIGEAGEALGGLDIFVANVSALAQGMDEAAWRRGFEIDVMSTVFGIEAALPLLERSRFRRNRRGRQHRDGRDLRSDPLLCRGKGGAAALHQGAGAQPRRQEHPGQHRLSGQRVLRGRRVGQCAPEQPRHVRSRCWHATRPGAWAHPRRSRTRWCSSPAHGRALSPARI